MKIYMTVFSNICAPKVSVIIPVYNVEPYLSEALESVINQTYKNLEIIVVDDGSNDGSEKICDEYAKKDDRIKVIHRQNGGLSAARNTGLDNMTGEYVAFLDSDDIFSLNAIEKSITAALLHKVDCVLFKRIKFKNSKNGKIKKIFNEKKWPNIKEGLYSREEALKAVANVQINAAVWNKLSRRQVWDNMRFPEGHIYEDSYVVFSMFDKIKNIYVLDDVLIFYRIRYQSISTTVSIKNVKDIVASWLVSENYIKTHIPELFDEEQLEKSRKITFNYFVLYYAKILSLRFPNKTEALSLMKDSICKLEKSIKIENCCAEIRLVYYLMFTYPILISIFFQPCYAGYRNIKSFAGIFTK